MQTDGINFEGAWAHSDLVDVNKVSNNSNQPPATTACPMLLPPIASHYGVPDATTTNRQPLWRSPCYYHQPPATMVCPMLLQPTASHYGVPHATTTNRQPLKCAPCYYHASTTNRSDIHNGACYYPQPLTTNHHPLDVSHCTNAATNHQPPTPVFCWAFPATCTPCWPPTTNQHSPTTNHQPPFLAARRTR